MTDFTSPDTYHGVRLWHARPPYRGKNFRVQHPLNIFLQVRLLRWASSGLYENEIEREQLLLEITRGEVPDGLTINRLSQILKKVIQYDPILSRRRVARYHFTHPKQLHFGLGHMIMEWLPAYCLLEGVSTSLEDILQESPSGDYEFYYLPTQEAKWHLSEYAISREDYPRHWFALMEQHRGREAKPSSKRPISSPVKLTRSEPSSPERG